MLHSIKDLAGYTIEAVDGQVGQPYEFCFDDQTWQLRYIVVETGDWLLGHKVLISMDRFGLLAPSERKFPLTLTLQQVLNSPGIETDKPVYLQRQSGVYDYLRWGSEAHMSGTWLISPLAAQLIDAAEQKQAQKRESYNPHLRSTREVTGYHIDATDGEIGHVKDFIGDDQTWQIGYIVIDTHNWLPGKKVMIAPKWIVRVHWPEKKVYVALQRQTIEHSPEFDLESLRRESMR
jgi:hypothetical protein